MTRNLLFLRLLAVAASIYCTAGLENNASCVRAAILYLVHPASLEPLYSSLTSLQQNFLGHFPGYPIFLFHDRELQEQHKLAPSHVNDLHWILLDDFDDFPTHHVDAPTGSHSR